MQSQRHLLIAAGAVCAAAVLAWAGLHRAPAPEPAFALGEPRASAPQARPSPPGAIVVYVAGEVAHPGVYRLEAGRRVDDALRAAGPPKADADLVAVNLAAPLEDGEEIAVPVHAGPARARGQRPALRTAKHHRQRKAASRSRRAPKRTAQIDAPLDLNTADVSALAALPGVGQSLAERIVGFREANGPFASVDGLADVNGITEGRLEKLLPYLVVR